MSDDAYFRLQDVFENQGMYSMITQDKLKDQWMTGAYSYDMIGAPLYARQFLYTPVIYRDPKQGHAESDFVRNGIDFNYAGQSFGEKDPEVSMHRRKREAREAEERKRVTS